MDVRVGPLRRLSAEELILLNCGAGEDAWESPLDCKEIQRVNPKGNQSWIFIGRTDSEAETPILWPPDVKIKFIARFWGWERLKARGEGGDRGWDGWMPSLTQWTWLRASSRGEKWTGKPGVLQSMGSQSRTSPNNWQQQRTNDVEHLFLRFGIFDI